MLTHAFMVSNLSLDELSIFYDFPSVISGRQNHFLLMTPRLKTLRGIPTINKRRKTRLQLQFNTIIFYPQTLVALRESK